METPVNQLLKNMEELSSMFSTRMGEFEKSLSQSGPTATTPTVKTLSAEFFTFKTLVWKTLGVLKSQIELVASGMDRLETQSRRKVLLIHGVGEDKDENVLQKVIGILSNHMKLPDVRSTAIESCHRLGVKKDTSRPIIVRFTNLQLRSSVWRAKTTLKGSKITISEFLTKARQEVFIAARKHYGIKKCWTSEGVIIILLPNKIKSKISSLSELKQLFKDYPAMKSNVDN